MDTNASKVSKELIEVFSGKEQWEFLEEVKSILNSYYIEKIEKEECVLKSIISKYEDFKGDKKT